MGARAEIVSARWASADIRAETNEELKPAALKSIQRLPIICRDWAQPKDAQQYVVSALTGWCVACIVPCWGSSLK
jgi:hypothetical protein